MTAPQDRTRFEALRRHAGERQAAGDRVGALEAYEAALALAPDDGDLLAGLARLALDMDMAQVSLQLWERIAAADPARLEAVDGQARALNALNRHGEAVELLRPAIIAHPHDARLWNTLGLTLDQQGDSRAALAFLDEAVRLEPAFAAALYNRGNVRFDLGEAQGAEADFDAAAPFAGSPADSARIAFARALLWLHRGELARGWSAYEARHHPDHPDAPVFEAPGRPWTADTPLDGLHLMAVGEQGVGDEVMFASLLADALVAVGAHGALSAAVDPRLTALFERSFPRVRVVAHDSRREAGRVVRRASPPPGREVDLWAPLAALAQRFRTDVAAFPDVAYLQPDPARVAHWRIWLGDGAPAVGLSWRSGLAAGGRRRQYPALEDWAPVLATPDVRWVDLQYGGEMQERAALEALAGRALRVAPGVDLREDLDDLAALACALDLVVSVPNATAALGAACGAPVWFVGAPAAWPRLGTEGYPWYPCARSFAATAFGAWAPVMAQVASALAPGRVAEAGAGFYKRRSI